MIDRKLSYVYFCTKCDKYSASLIKIHYDDSNSSIYEHIQNKLLIVPKKCTFCKSSKHIKDIVGKNIWELHEVTNKLLSLNR